MAQSADNTNTTNTKTRTKTNANATSSQSSPAQSNLQWVPPSDYQYCKPFGGMHGFMRSYGLKHWEPGAYDEAKAIIAAFREDDRLEWEENNKGN